MISPKIVSRLPVNWAAGSYSCNDTNSAITTTSTSSQADVITNQLRKSRCQQRSFQMLH